MTNRKSAKRALLGSVVAMVLCLAMLVGATFAWFTDTASTGVNKIQAGNLDVQLQYATAWDENGNVTTWADAQGKQLEFKKAAGAENETILWEPGCTYKLPELRVVNKGNLALKYKVAITGINGSAKLNDVIDWTINDADINLTEMQLKAGEEGAAFTIKGHMQESAGNDYMNESIDGVAITVVATQDTVESDSFNNTYDANATYPVVAVGDVNTDGDTVIQDREKDPTVIATIPAGSTDAGKLTLVKTEGQTPANIEIVTGTDAVTTEVRLEDQNGNKVTAADGKFFTIALQLEKKLNVIGFYHSETPLTKAESAEAVKAANDTYYYDAATGLLTFSTDDFSPFTVVTSSSVFNGGNGTKANPYLVATGEQALKMENAKGYFKLVDDVVITDECQFFTPAQIDQLRRLVDERDLPVLCFGLRTDFLTHLFPGSLRLFELADSITEIKTICACGSKATVNARIDSNGHVVTKGEQVFLGGNDSYLAMCHSCWKKRIAQEAAEGTKQG